MQKFPLAELERMIFKHCTNYHKGISCYQIRNEIVNECLFLSLFFSPHRASDKGQRWLTQPSPSAATATDHDASPRAQTVHRVSAHRYTTAKEAKAEPQVSSGWILAPARVVCLTWLSHPAGCYPTHSIPAIYNFYQLLSGHLLMKTQVLFPISSSLWIQRPWTDVGWARQEQGRISCFWLG